jgi:thiamine-monophosphate kinase
VSGPLSTPLGPGREFDRIRKMAERWKFLAKDLGDDCAFVTVGGATLAVSIDLSVEGVHFRRDWLSPQEIGYRAAAAALSDLAAVAAEPTALLLALGAEEKEPEATLHALADGVGEAVRHAGAVIIGGDLTRAPQLVVDCCVIGKCITPVRRSGARPGDVLVVTGSLGGPLAALTAWQAGREPSSDARHRFARPEPRHQAAAYLARLGARAMIDLSDGLGGDLQHLLAASGVGARVEADRIPVHPAAAREAQLAGEPAWEFAARSGEEYELLAALPAGTTDAVLRAAPVPLAVIGAVEAEPGARAFLRGVPVALPHGFDHFAAEGR